jgi:hypothetical protein
MFEKMPSAEENVDNGQAAEVPTENNAAENEKNLELREIRKCKENVINFMKGLGVEADPETLPSDEEIFIGELDESSSKSGADTAYKIRVNKDLPPSSRFVYDRLGMEEQIDELSKDGRMRELTYKLIRYACGKIDHDGPQPEIDAKPQMEKFDTYEKTLSELTTHQLFLAEGATPDHITNPYRLIFLSVLIEDMTERLNGGDPLTTSNPKLPGSFKEKIKARMEISFDDPKRKEAKFKEADILAFFQKGAFESDEHCLEMIGTIYGEKALDALSSMSEEPDSIIAVARTFKPQYNPTDIGNKTGTLISYLESNLSTRIKIADKEAHISIVNLL